MRSTADATLVETLLWWSSLDRSCHSVCTLSILPNTSRAHAETAQGSYGPLAPFLDGESNIAVMTKDFFSFFQTRLSRFLALIVDELFASPEAHTAVPFPSHIRIAAMVGKAPHRMHCADFRSAIEALLCRCCAYYS